MLTSACESYETEAAHLAPSLPRALSWGVALVHVANRATALIADASSPRVDQHAPVVADAPRGTSVAAAHHRLNDSDRLARTGRPAAGARNRPHACGPQRQCRMTPLVRWLSRVALLPGDGAATPDRHHRLTGPAPVARWRYWRQRNRGCSASSANPSTEFAGRSWFDSAKRIGTVRGAGRHARVSPAAGAGGPGIVAPPASPPLQRVQPVAYDVTRRWTSKKSRMRRQESSADSWR